MGEWMTQVPVKLSPETVARLDLLRAAYPFKPGRSTVIRELVEEGLRLIAEGIMQFRATTSNRVPSVQSVQSVPNEFPAFPVVGQEKKPPVRVHGVPSGRGQSIHGVNRRSYLGAGVRLAWLCPPFRATKSPLKSNSFRRVA